MIKRYWRQKADAEPELPIALSANLDHILRLKNFFRPELHGNDGDCAFQDLVKEDY
jgi:hypothetical protein